MGTLYALVAVAALVPLAVLVVEHLGNVRISERHHSRHDTYVIPVARTRSIVLCMAFMGGFGLLVGWLCYEQVFDVNGRAVMCFFDSFVLTCLVIWLAACRYRISAFDDCMDVRPLVGPSVRIRYEDIGRMRWTGLRKGSGYRDLQVVVGGRPVAVLLGVVDLEQVLMRIDRFDVLEHAS